jgi:nucleoside-diphosphate-sugar epimerase
MIEGIYRLMQSDLEGPVNIGSPGYVTVDELAYTIAEVAAKKINIKHIEGPVGVQSRNFSNAKIYTTGWRAQFSLKEGIAQTYPWVEEQVKASTSVRK